MPMSPMGYGYNPMAALWMMSQMPQGPARDLTRASQTMLEGSASEMPGALSRMQSARDAAAEEKMAAINRAMATLSNVGANAPQMSQLAAGAGFLAPTHTGTATESIGNAAHATLEQAMQQRTFEEENALRMAQMALQKAGIPEERAAQEVQDIYGRFQMGRQAAQDAAMANYRSGMVNARMGANQARVTAAQVMADRQRFKYLGADPTATDSTQAGVYLDQQSGQQVYGPAAEAPHVMTPAQAMLNARFDYSHRPAKTDGSPADPPPEGQGEWMKRRQAYYMQPLASPLGAASPGHTAPPPAPPSAPAPQPGAQPTGPGTTQPWLHVQAPLQNGKPVRPTGVPDNAVYSQMTKSWWWQNAAPQR